MATIKRPTTSSRKPGSTPKTAEQSSLNAAAAEPQLRATARSTVGGPSDQQPVHQYRHCKPILAIGAGTDLLDDAGIPTQLPDGEEDPGLIRLGGEDIERALPLFIEAVAKHRHYARALDPPSV